MIQDYGFCGEICLGGDPALDFVDDVVWVNIENLGFPGWERDEDLVVGGAFAILLGRMELVFSNHRWVNMRTGAPCVVRRWVPLVGFIGFACHGVETGSAL